MSDTRVSVRPYVIGPSATSFVVPSGDADLNAWVAAVNALAGSSVVSATQQGYVGTLIAGLKADGDWTNFDGIWLFGGENVSQQAAIDIKGLVQGSPVNSPTLSARGYTGNGTTSYFNTTLIAGAGNYQLDSGTLGVYDVVTPDRTTPEPQAAIGSSYTAVASLSKISILADASGTCYSSVNETTSGIQPSTTSAQGLYIATRTASNLEKLFRNGALLGGGFNPVTTASVNIPDVSWMICGARFGSSPNYFTADTIALGFFAGGMSDAALVRVSARFNAYATSWGINTYT